MSLKNVADLCSHLNNCTKARLSLACVLNTKRHLRLALALQNTGLISTVVRAGESPPAAHHLLGQPAVTERDGVEVCQENVASRRLWLGLKYYQNESVLGKMTMVSTSRRDITVKLPALRQLVQGKDCPGVKGLRSPGECLFIATDRGVLEARQCLEQKVGGLVLCRVK